jgi:DNA-binding NarL/FixJ family response regulator
MAVLCITNNSTLISDIKIKFSDAKDLLFLDTVETLKDEKKSYDIVLIDFEVQDSLVILKELKIIKPMLPKIIILKDNNEQDLVHCINYGAYSI